MCYVGLLSVKEIRCGDGLGGEHIIGAMCNACMLDWEVTASALLVA